MNSELIRFSERLRETFHVELPSRLPERLHRFHVELLEWNPVAALVSESTSEADLWRHSVDSLTLLPYLHRRSAHAGPHIDVGSGGGFPALPVALALPDMLVVCIERNARKAAFLRRIARILELDHVAVEEASFDPTRIPEGSTLTARAIEKPKDFVKRLHGQWPVGLEFWSQLRDTRDLFGKDYTVDEIHDGLEAFRRGRLFRVTRGDVPRGT